VDTGDIAALAGHSEISLEWLGTTSAPHQLVESALHEIFHSPAPELMAPGHFEVVIVGQSGMVEISLL
jgi:hypothetical protein